MVDVAKGTNSYYKLQVLESDGGMVKRYCVFRSWEESAQPLAAPSLDVRICTDCVACVLSM